MKKIFKLYIYLLTGIFSAAFLLTSCPNKTEGKRTENDVNPYISFTTNKNIGEKIELRIDAESSDKDSIWIDLNNDGKQSPDEKVKKFGSKVSDISEFVLCGKTVTLYGKVTLFNCQREDIKIIDTAHCPSLKVLNCADNNLISLDVSLNTSLVKLDCFQNGISSLDVNKNINLEKLNCSGNMLRTLDVSGNKKLKTLGCSGNKLSVLNLKNNTALKVLYCFGNTISSIDLTANTALEELDCSENMLTALDLSENHVLKEIKCFTNKIPAEKMDILVKSLKDRKNLESGELTVINSAPEAADENICTAAQVNIAKDKNWKVYDSDKFPQEYSGS